MNRKSVRIMALVASVAFAACGENDLILSELTEAEADDLAGAVMLATFSSTGDVPQPAEGPNGPQMAPFEMAVDVNFEAACPLGGLVAVSAELDVSGDDATGAGAVDYAMTQVHDGCVVVSENQRMFTLWGAPGLTLDFMVENDGQGRVVWEGGLSGAVDWVTDGREGSCEVDLEFGGVREGEAAIQGELAGVVCGFSISRSFSLGVG